MEPVLAVQSALRVNKPARIIHAPGRENDCGVYLLLLWTAASHEFTFFATLWNGYPGGMTGVYTTVANTGVNFFIAQSAARSADMIGR